MTPKKHTHKNCPSCGESQCAGLIREKIVRAPGKPPMTDAERRKWYGDYRCFERTIGIEYPYDHPNHYDGVSEWLYPCCGARYSRFTGARIAGIYDPLVLERRD